MIDRAVRLCPRVTQLPIAAAWAGAAAVLPDRLPAIGQSRAVAGLWLATGHEGVGVALGPITGRLIAQLETGEAPAVEPAPFDPDRFDRQPASA
jgi:glycine/D-amino acid oxidase-like deaminating enzyme